MPAAPGAISKVKWEDGKLVIGVIDDVEPVGICGTGLIDALAAFLDAFEGIVSEQGTEGLDRFCKNPADLMVKAGVIIEDIASFTASGEAKK